jgi:tRNA threonylcarbamoyladenosine biosynthesis protein TsaE
VLTKGIAAGLGISCNITSPTFTLICEYEGSLMLYHMDVYRLADYSEFETTGGKELLFSGGVSVIEWAEKIAEYLPKDIIKISIDIKKDNSREILVSGLIL